jgi:hypothetical protein
MLNYKHNFLVYTLNGIVSIISSVLGLLSVVSTSAFGVTAFFISIHTDLALITLTISMFAIPLTILAFLTGRIIDIV